ncbi:MAG: metallophosphoesterase [Myxococcota bacterium]
MATSLLAGGAARAEWSGLVFVDRNANGVRDTGEPGRAGTVISNGREVVRSGADGRYRLPEAPAEDGGFVFVTRPRGFECAQWFHRGPGDFALVPVEALDNFFFVQISDVHAYDRAQDFADFSVRGPFSWAPQWAQAWFMLRIANRMLSPRFTEDVSAELRTALAPHRDVEGKGDTRLFMDYLDEFNRPGSELGDVASQIRRALQEVAALRPAFLISTGDLVLEGNQAPPDVVERWLAFYRETTRALGVPVYNTIGNNEIAGSERDDISIDDPRYGKSLFKTFYGPTYYSFDRGAFHFAALDTHQPKQPGSKRWDFNRLSAQVKNWLDADLALHPEATRVVLNHEPFHFDPDWPMPDNGKLVVSDEGLFERHGVAYVLAGHTHLNGFEERGPTTHITTGALSGFRWLLPPGLYPRGYRLFYARGTRLYSAWKEVGQVALGFIDPVGDASLHPASAGALRPEASAVYGAIDLVAVAADRSGPFARLRLLLDGASVPFERWGDYFLHARLAPAPLPTDVPSGRSLVLEAIRASGEIERVELRFPPPGEAR